MKKLATAVTAIALIGTPAFAADMAVKAPPPPPAPAPVPYTWTGFYLGLGAGGRWTSSDVTTVSATVGGAPATMNGPATQSFALDVFRLSPYVGYDWQFAPQWLVGVEGEAGFGSKTSTVLGIPWSPGFGNSGNPNDTLTFKASWDASALVRVGYLVTPTLLGYVIGGASWLHYSTTSTCLVEAGACFPGAFAPNVITNSETKLGWTVGAGIEAKLWSSWYARAEYRYADFGTQSFTLTRSVPGVITDVANYNVKVFTQVATVGIAYKFGAGPQCGYTAGGRC